MKNDNHRLVSCIVYCDKCKKEYDINFNETNYDSTESIRFRSYESECELCGSHGEIELLFTCPECKRKQEKTIVLDSW